ncbi:MAG: translation initiation factor IF-1 [Saprospiraceae bacterium]
MNNLIVTKGTIIKIVDKTSFKVKMKDETVIDATISGKMKMCLDFDIYEGEEVPIDMSPHDRTRGRINLRSWTRNKLEK